MKHYLLVYSCTLIIMVLLDVTWIGVLARDFYKARIDNIEFHALPAVLFYIVYCAGIVIFINGNAATTLPRVLLYGALFGFFAYATYDLTNLATLKGWSVSLAMVDIMWGAFTTAVSASVGFWIAAYFERG